MADKAKNSKRPWQAARKSAMAASAVRRDKRKAARVAKQKAAEARNKRRQISDDGTPFLTPWELAKAQRRARREGKPAQPRTNCGNILVKGADGIQRVRPGTKREVEMALQIRQAEAQREAEAQRQTKAKKLKKAS